MEIRRNGRPQQTCGRGASELDRDHVRALPALRVDVHALRIHLQCLLFEGVGGVNNARQKAR
eukprot:2978115-Rhodomonas_salina.1